MPIVLRSPFNGQNWTVPETLAPTLVDELLKRGFERVYPDTPNERDKHGSSQSARRSRTRTASGADSRSGHAAAFDAEPGTHTDAADAVED